MKNYDLEERTINFSLEVINLCKKIESNTINNPLVSQLVRSATSVGANYQEANGASSKKDFLNKIYLCKKEAKESAYWLRILRNSTPPLTDGLLKIEDEAQQLVLIFGKIAYSTNKLKNL
ncbi:MAG: four helix bundle protein [Patescibacteria group bacterium]|nr:four helix bundle protein [Patescibacteria group bacterium]